MPWRPSAALRWSVGARRRISVEDAAVADTAENLDASASEVVTDGNRVIAGVEHLAVFWQEAGEATDLFDGG
jgi:hypothetical protein